MDNEDYEGTPVQGMAQPAPQGRGGRPGAAMTAGISNAASQSDVHPQKFDVSASRGFPAWLHRMGASLSFTTYQAGKVFFIGLNPDGRLSLFERTIPRCLGMTFHQNSLYISSLWQIWRFENVLPPGQLHDGYDRLYKPQMSWVTGDLDVHDMAVDKSGRLLFVNTLFCCLATVSGAHSFVPLWKPPFISKLAAEDRCHLNGLAMKDGLPKYMTAVAESDGPDGWREHRRTGGIVIDIDTNEIVCRGLSMPHSPRWHDGRLWLHNSGTGEFGFADLKTGKFEPVAFCPGYLRGLDFIGQFAVTGLSRIRTRNTKSFGGLQLDEKLAEKKLSSRSGIFIIDLKSGDITDWFQVEGAVEELYDTAILPGVHRPMAVGFLGDEVRRMLTMAEPAAKKPA